jgi:alpha-tubulin suppressor-like RCC1 family protein
VRVRPELETEEPRSDETAAEADTAALESLSLPEAVRPIAIALGYYTTCVALADGRVGCFGDNHAAFGLEDTSDGVTVIESVRDATDVVVGKRRACAFHRGGNLVCWPDRYGRVRAGPEGIVNVQSAAVGEHHSCASFDEAGHVRCLGSDDWLQSQSPFSSRRWWVEGLEGVAEVATGASHTCARHEDGGVTCWGDNRENQMGDGSDRVRARPARVPWLADVRQIASDSMAAMTCALDADGGVACWGAHGVGRAGGATRLADDGERLTALAGITQISVGPWEVCARTESGEVHCYHQSLASARGDDGPVFGEPTRLAGIEGARSVSVGAMHACALLESGDVACWGSNTYGQLGDGTRQDREAPVLATALRSLVETERDGDGGGT